MFELVSAGILAANTANQFLLGSASWNSEPVEKKQQEFKTGGDIIQKAMTDYVEQFVFEIPIESILYEEPDVTKYLAMESK